MSNGFTLAAMLQSPGGVFAPLVLNPLMARLAEEAGFRAGYVGGGAMGYLNCATEANLSLTQMVQTGLEIRAASSLPLVMDGTAGWGDPMHIRHTVQSAEAAGYAAIEIEDQVLPKRAHHHVGIEHLVPADLMTAKIAEAVAVRRDTQFLVIARTNAARSIGLDEALRRAEMFHRAGADVLLVMPGRRGDLRAIVERLPGPFMYMVPTTGVGALEVPLSELPQLGFKLVVDPATPFFAMARALRLSYAALAQHRVDPTVGDQGAVEERAVHGTIGLDVLLDVERRTVERGFAA